MPMEDEMQERLEKVYNFPIDVKFLDFRKYEIFCQPTKPRFLYSNFI